jgi:TPR repeat protein
MRTAKHTLLAGCLLLTASVAASPPQAVATPDGLTFTELERAEGLAIAGHPNELWRVRALRALKLGQMERAVDAFRTAAGYADKYSQHALSLLYWHGAGVGRDRALAYAWSDLAAERGYRGLLLVREKMWMELGNAERDRARELGPDLYARFGDAAAQPRMEWELRKARARITGSRLGFEKDRVRFAQNRYDVDADDAFAAERWTAADYWQAEDRAWAGKVLVLPAQRADAATAPAPED